MNRASVGAKGLVFAAIALFGPATMVPSSAAEAMPTAGPPAVQVATPAASTSPKAAERSDVRAARKRARLEDQATRKLARIEQRRAARIAARQARPSSTALTPSTVPGSVRIRPQVAGVTITAGPVTSTPTGVQEGDLNPAELQEILDRWTSERTDLGALSVTVRQNGTSWSGTARNSGSSPDPLERYRSLSVTKTITAALILRQVELGTLSLDTPLPPLAGIDSPLPPGLTIRQLLRHRSGLTDYNAAPGYSGTAPLNARQAVELSLRAPLRHPVGTTTSYTNSNYLYLGLLLEQVTGRTYGDLVGELTARLGMTQTSVEPPDRAGWPAFSSGGVMSTTADLALWGEALTNGERVLRRSSLDEMLRFDENNSGLGMWTYCPCPTSAGLIVGHHTATGGMFIVPSTGLVIVMRADVETGDTAGRARSFIDAVIARRSV